MRSVTNEHHPLDGVMDTDSLVALFAAYGECIDEERFDEWTDFFTDDARYRVTTAENHKKGYPVGLIDCMGKAMMKDRIFGLKSANVYEPHSYRHIISCPRIVCEDGAGLRVKTSFLVARTMAASRTELFISGYYDDLLVNEGGLKFKSRLVVCDASLIDMLIVIPL